MHSNVLQARALHAAQIFRKAKLNQERIAADVGVSQSQVSRILAGRAARQSKVFDAVCSYAERIASGVSIETVRRNEELLGALAETWDGSADHARALAAVIRSLAILGPHGPVASD